MFTGRVRSTYKVFSIVLLAAFLTVLFSTLAHLASSNMSGAMADFPYMHHTEVLCPMNLLDHLTAWKASYLAIAPPIITVVLMVVGVFMLVSRLLGVRTILLSYSGPPLHVRHIRTHRYLPQLLQQLFASGILHPKLH